MKVFRSMVLNAPVAQVWAAVRAFARVSHGASVKADAAQGV